MGRDARNIPLTGTTPAALEHYERAVVQYHSFVGDCIDTIDTALAEAPAFVMGHLFKAISLVMFSEQRYMPQARASVAAAEALAAGANARERLLTRAARLLVDGEWDAASQALDRVLVDDPLDSFTIQSAHLMDFLRGDALNLRNRVSRVLPHWSPAVPGYSYVLSMHAFGLEECNQYAEAEDTARRALAIEPKDAWGVHAVAHVMEMQGRMDEGIAWLESRERDWAPDNAFAVHNWWHLALFNLDRQRHRRVLELYDTRLYPEPVDDALVLLDATALLWRLHLDDVPLGARAHTLADAWERKLDEERGYYAFNDFHAMLALVMAERDAAAGRLMADVEHTAEHGAGLNRVMTQQAGLPLCRAVQAFGAGRYGDAAELIAPARDTANRFGGSHAQRDILTLTLIEAAIRDGRPAVARHYLGERLTHKPASGTGWRLLARAEAPPTAGAAVRAAA